MTVGDEQRRTTRAIYVGYKMRLTPGAEKMVPEFKAPYGYMDATKIDAFLKERRAGFLEEAKNMPYTGTFEEVFLIDPNARDEKRPEETKIKTLQYRWHPPEEGKPSIAVRVRNYLVKNYPTAWTHDTHGRKTPEVIFVGFDPRTFLKFLGLECSLPAVGTPCPLGLWYGNTDHRDIGEAVCPKEFQGLTLPFVLGFRRPINAEAAAQWDVLIKGWTGPGENPEKDARITFELAGQLLLGRDE